jgi:hypothetical protein
MKRHLSETEMILFVRRRITLVALMIASQSAVAQEPRRLAQPDSVPLELAGALIASGGFGAEPQILIGMLPGWMNSRVFLPQNGRVLGSAFIGSVTVGVLAVRDQPDVAIAAFESELAKRGWKAPRSGQQPPISGGGFRSAPTPPAVDPSPVTRLVLCGGDQQMLTVSATRRSQTTTQVIYRVTPTSAYGPCSAPQQPASPRGERSIHPTLINPTDVIDFRNYGHCSSPGLASETSASVRTPGSLDSLMQHYARQLQDSGWRPTPARSVGQTWSRTDSTGQTFEARLTLSASPRDSLCRDLNLMVSEVRKP